MFRSTRELQWKFSNGKFPTTMENLDFEAISKPFAREATFGTCRSHEAPYAMRNDKKLVKI